MKWDFTNEKHLEKIKSRVRLSLTKFTGKTTDAEDAFQEIVEYFLSGKGQKQTIDQAVIDYLRRSSGRKGQPGYAERIAPQKQLCENHVGRDVGLSMDDRCTVNSLIGMSRHWERAVMTLYFREGFCATEIGNFFGVTESRVSQWLARIQKRISNKIKGEESRSPARQMEALLPSQTEGDEWRVEQNAFERMEIGQSWSLAVFNEASF